MNSNKWFLEVVEDYDGTYYANLIMNGKRVTGLPEHVNYNTLRDGIRQETGIEILKRKDMKFQQSGRKKYAYIDNTQERSDCRVTLDEVKHGWKPDFETKTEPQERKVSLDETIRSASTRAKESSSTQTEKMKEVEPDR